MHGRFQFVISDLGEEDSKVDDEVVLEGLHRSVLTVWHQHLEAWVAEGRQEGDKTSVGMLRGGQSSILII